MTKVLVPNDIQQDICDLYVSGKPMSHFKDMYGYSQNLVIRILNDNRILVRSRSESNRKYDCNNEFFSSIDSEQKAYWLGFFAADGNVKTSEPIIRIELSTSDREHLEKFRKSIESNYPIRDRTVRTGYTPGVHASTIEISSAQMKADLTKHGFGPQKTLKLQWPSTVPYDLLRHFLRGYMDGDGGIYYVEKYRGLLFSITSTNDFLDGCQKYLEKELGFNTVQSLPSTGGNVHKLQISGNMKVPLLYHLLYNECEIYLDRKYSKATNNILLSKNDKRRDKLNWEKAARIRNSKDKTSVLSSMYDVSDSTIRSIKSGRIWRV